MHVLWNLRGGECLMSKWSPDGNKQASLARSPLWAHMMISPCNMMSKREKWGRVCLEEDVAPAMDSAKEQMKQIAVVGPCTDVVNKHLIKREKDVPPAHSRLWNLDWCHQLYFPVERRLNKAQQRQLLCSCKVPFCCCEISGSWSSIRVMWTVGARKWGQYLSLGYFWDHREPSSLKFSAAQQEETALVNAPLQGPGFTSRRAHWCSLGHMEI